MTILSGTLLGILETAGEAILTLTDNVEPEEFFSSRITQDVVAAQLKTMTETVNNFPDELRLQMLEIDWSGWTVLKAQLLVVGALDRDAAWFAIRSLVPATLMWLRVYRKNHPELFSIVP